MGDQSLPKSGLLRKPWQYRLVYERGRRLRGRNFSLIFLVGGSPESRLGISIHGEKLAVRRNRIKRVIREFFRQNKEFIAQPSDVIFAVRAGFTPDSPLEVQQAVNGLLAGRGVRPEYFPLRIKEPGCEEFS